MAKMKLNAVVNGDCIKKLNSIKEPFADLIFADPPFNIGYQYDVYKDNLAYQEYYDWTEKWMAACTHVMKPFASFWIAIGAEYAADVCMIGRELKLTLRNWIIWHYTFGQNTKKKFARSHTHLFYFVKNPQNFTFNEDAVSVFSDREVYYNDKRANPKGRIPDDVWDEFPRVCGTFSEREGWHPCQMPEALLARVIRTCSNPGDVVFDPFAGSGTTLATAKKLNRQYLGYELSKKYCNGIDKRLDAITPFEKVAGEINEHFNWPKEHIELLKDTYREFSVGSDKLNKNNFLLLRFTERFNWRLAHSMVTVPDKPVLYYPKIIGDKIELLRKQGELPKIRVQYNEPKN